MNNELKEIFKVCDALFINSQIDFNELKNKKIDLDFFENYLNIRLLNSYLFNFSKLQDKIGAKLFRNVLYNLKEIDSYAIPMIDILNILEKLEIIENQNEWEELREIRNSLSHEYPFSVEERIENIYLALDGYETLHKIYFNLKKIIK